MKKNFIYALLLLLCTALDGSDGARLIRSGSGTVKSPSVLTFGPAREPLRRLVVEFTVIALPLYVNLNIRIGDLENPSRQTFELYRGENEQAAGYSGTFLRSEQRTEKWRYSETLPGEIRPGQTYRLEVEVTPDGYCKLHWKRRLGDGWQLLFQDIREGEKLLPVTTLRIDTRPGAETTFTGLPGQLEVRCHYSNYLLIVQLLRLQWNELQLLNESRQNAADSAR